MNDLAKAIQEAARRKIRIQERRRKQAHEETVRRQRRSGSTIPTLRARDPEFWNYDRSHNPFHVRARSESIAHAIEKSIRSGTYSPLPPTGFVMPKAGKTHRTVTAFSIADEVVSKRLYSSLMNKNRTRLSARSYAYRKDLGVHDAIFHIQSEWSTEHRLYVAQYDFADYFGSVDHNHIWSTVSNIKLAITRTERRLLRAFMESPLPTLLPAKMPIDPTPPPREIGIHQGTTISLLLANIAATPLDREFERLGVSFARYADDIVIWCRDYDNIGRAVDELHRFADRSHCTINHSKSQGISILSKSSKKSEEFRTTRHIEFLSHRISLRRISLAERTIDSAKNVIDQYIYNHLLREPINGTQNISRLHGNLDRDYIALMSQLRRFLYGSLSEEQLRRLLRGPLPSMMSLGGLLGRHPSVNDTDQLKRLDGWISNQVWLALRKRSHLLRGSLGNREVPEPWGFTEYQLATFITRSTRGDRLPVDGRIPSSVRMAELVRRAVLVHGTRVATHTPSLYNWL